jgi:hypothetical protein
MRMEVCTESSVDLKAAIAAFLRRLACPWMWEELIEPALSARNSLLVLAVTDRPWPPWGIGGRQIEALTLVHPIGEDNASVMPIMASAEQATNIGLHAALFKRTLEELISQGKENLDLLLADSSVACASAARDAGFEPTKDPVLTDTARYFFHRAKARTVLSRLGLTKLSTTELLLDFNKSKSFTRNALFHLTLRAGFEGAIRGRRWSEVIPNTGGAISALPPGGVPDPPPTPGPQFGFITLDSIR